MLEQYYGIIFALLLSILHFYSNSLKKITKLKGRIFLSLSSGILITLIFVELIPAIADATIVYSNILFLLVLVGFSLFHLIEKHAYHHDIKRRAKEITELHSYGFFLEHFILGYFLVLILKSSLTAGLIAIIPFALMTISSSISLEAIHHSQKKDMKKKMLLASSTLLGAIVSTLLQISPAIFFYSFSFIVGAITYIVTRDVIPKEEEEDKQIEFFIIGILITLLSLYASSTAI